MNPLTQWLKIAAAINQLARSERGEQVARDFYAMLQNGADSLDSTNWLALTELLAACASGFTDEVRGQIAERLRIQ